MFQTVKYGEINAYLGTISDAVEFDFDGKAGHYTWMPRLTGADSVAGPVFTCVSTSVRGESDIKDHVRIDMLEAMTDGCIQVLSGCGQYPEIAHFGDISGLLARQAGALGCVLDGNTRDVDALNQMGFPIWGSGIHVEDAYGKWQIIDYDVPISFFAMPVRSGDWIFCDGDGIFVVYADYVERVIDAAINRTVNESSIRHELKSRKPREVYEERGRW